MKKIFLCLLIFISAAAVFSRSKNEAESAGLTRTDIENFIDNYNQIQRGLNEISAYFEPGDDALKSASEYFLAEYGISGPERLYKYTMIINCFSYAVQAEAIAENKTLRQTWWLLKTNPFKQLRKMISKKDYMLVCDYFDDLKKVTSVYNNQ